MNKINPIKQMTFANNLIKIFQKYANNLDTYFKDDKNKEEHKELYNFYQELIKRHFYFASNFQQLNHIVI